MEHVLNAHLDDRKDIHLAVGLDVGTVLVTRLGKKGERDVICLGPQATSAEGLQLRSSGQEIRLSKALYDSIDRDAVKHQFAKDAQVAPEWNQSVTVQVTGRERLSGPFLLWPLRRRPFLRQGFGLFDSVRTASVSATPLRGAGIPSP
jgi:class 3 adenylate cyclase